MRHSTLFARSRMRLSLVFMSASDPPSSLSSVSLIISVVLDPSFRAAVDFPLLKQGLFAQSLNHLLRRLIRCFCLLGIFRRGCHRGIELSCACFFALSLGILRFYSLEWHDNAGKFTGCSDIFGLWTDINVTRTGSQIHKPFEIPSLYVVS